MASIQERLQIKRVPIDKWSTREQLCLASAVGRSGDQNWMSVSRALKLFGDPNRPADWFSQKNCAAQYGSLLENVETPKRKKRTSSAGQEAAVETPGESILRKLTHERMQDLKSILEAEKKEYLKLKEEIEALENNKSTETQIDEWRLQLEEEDKQKEKDAAAHALWLKEREQRKQEVERAWRPMIKLPVPTMVGQKRKASESMDSISNSDMEGSVSEMDTQEPAKPALSPLLTSLLKSPSQVSSPATSILHSAITATSRSTPTIASLLNSSTNVAVSPGLQQLVTTAIGQEPAMATSTAPSALVPTTTTSSSSAATSVAISEDAKEVRSNSANSESITEAAEKSPNNDEVMSETTTMDLNLPTPTSEMNLQSECDEDSANGNGSNTANENGTPDIPESVGGISSLEATENSSTDTPVGVAEDSKSKDSIGSPTNTDSMFAENDEEASTESSAASAPLMTPTAPISVEIKKEEVTVSAGIATASAVMIADAGATGMSSETTSTKEVMQSGSVEIVEVHDFEDSDKEHHSPNEITPESVHTHAGDDKSSIIGASEESSTPPPTEKTLETDSTVDDSEKDASEKSPDVLGIAEDSKEPGPNSNKDTIDIDLSEPVTRRSTFSPEFTEAFFDDMAIEVTKLDKSGRAKRDYSRTSKKKEEKDFDILLAVEKAASSQLGDTDLGLGEDTSSEKEFGEVTGSGIGSGGSGGLLESSLMGSSSKKGSDVTSGKMIGFGKVKDNDRSNSPWMEDEGRRRRRYSTPATPVDSVPNSPASSIIAYYDDDRDYRNWKKSAMLIHSRLATHKDASLFMKPITDELAPGYHSVIYRPMDLQTIRKNIETGIIRTTAEFRRDVLLMFSNAVMYNKSNSHVYKVARQMQTESLQQLQIFVQAQKEGETPGRRETRTSEPGLKRKRHTADDGSAVSGTASASSSTSALSASISRAKKRREELT